MFLFSRDTWEDICLAADSMRPMDWAVFLCAMIIEIGFVALIILILFA
jgi:hypothetical protein